MLAALQRATAIRQPGAGAMHHADRGSSYASHDYCAALRQHGMTASLSRTGNCWNNAVAESFFATLEWERLAGSDFATRAMASRALVPFIDSWYNWERLHSAFGYVLFNAFEQDLTRRRRAAETQCPRNRVKSIRPFPRTIERTSRSCFEKAYQGSGSTPSPAQATGRGVSSSST